MYLYLHPVCRKAVCTALTSINENSKIGERNSSISNDSGDHNTKFVGDDAEIMCLNISQKIITLKYSVSVQKL